MSNNIARIDNNFGAPATTGGEGRAMAEAESHRAIAEVQAAVMMAKQFPRDQRRAVDRILDSCTRTSLADAAMYQYARGGTNITGPSIRLAEAIAQQWGNIQFGFREIGRGVGPDGVGYSEVESYAWDIETNTRKPINFRVRHWRDTKKGGYPLKDERDIYELVANQAARRTRNCILAVIPGDVVESAVQQCDVTLKTQIEITPETIKNMLDKFSEYGVTKEQLEKRIQRRMDAITPALVLNLRKIFNSLKDGMSSPDEWFEPETAPQENEALNRLKDMPKKPVPTEAKVPEKEAEPAASNQVEKPEEKAAQVEPEAEPEQETKPRGRGRPTQGSMIE